MTAKRVLMCPQGLRARARAPTCPPFLRHWSHAPIIRILQNLYFIYPI